MSRAEPSRTTQWKSGIRKGNKLQRLLQREAFWIFQLKATIFPGLNEELVLTWYL